MKLHLSQHVAIRALMLAHPVRAQELLSVDAVLCCTTVVLRFESLSLAKIVYIVAVLTHVLQCSAQNDNRAIIAYLPMAGCGRYLAREHDQKPFIKKLWQKHQRRLFSPNSFLQKLAHWSLAAQGSSACWLFVSAVNATPGLQLNEPRVEVDIQITEENIEFKMGCC
jgi:hypothetical protein